MHAIALEWGERVMAHVDDGLVLLEADISSIKMTTTEYFKK